MLATAEMELPFTTYQDRQYHEITREGLAARATKLAPGGKFSFQGGSWTPEPYVGHAVVSMVTATPANSPLMTQLQSIQNELSYEFADPSSLYLLPPASFHQTIANTLSAEKHERLVVARGLAKDYPKLVTDVFPDLPPSPGSKPLTMRMIGLSLFSTAIGLLGVFDSEQEFLRVTEFRDHFYGHERIGSLGIRRTRPFIGHITLGYIEAPLDEPSRARLVEIAAAINQLISSRDLRFHLPHAELRAYSHLADFRSLPGLPVYSL